MDRKLLEISPASGLICNLTIPNGAKSMVIFVHGRGSNRFSTRNQTIASYLNDKGYATVLVDLLNVDEQSQDSVKSHLRFDIDLLTERLVVVTRYLCENDKTNNMTMGYVGSSTGAAAAINASAVCDRVKTLVLRGGRTDMAKAKILESIEIPTLYIAGENDESIVHINRRSLKQMSSCKSKQLVIIPGASHEFKEPGKINKVAIVSGQWLDINLLKENKAFNPSGGSSKLKQKFHDCLKKRRISLVFDDRISSASILSNMLDKYKSHNDVAVIAIPRGGILLADVIASKLTGGNFNLLLSVRLRNPHFSEKTLGSILQDETVYLTSECNQFSSEYLDMEIKHQKKVLHDLKQFYKIEDEDYRLQGKTVILLDDGSYSGSTIINACSWVKNHYPRKIIVGIPVISKNAFKLLDDPIIKIEYIYKPNNFYSVEKYYRDFSLPKPEELLNIINRRP